MGALAGFNIGVEIGQMGIVAVVVPVLGWVGRRDLVVRYGSMAIMTAGLYWTVVRLFVGSKGAILNPCSNSK